MRKVVLPQYASAPAQIPQGSAALRAHRLLVRVALSGANLFAWIFVFQYFFARSNELNQALLVTVFLYALSHLVTLGITPLSARQLRNGANALMAQGMLVAVAAYLTLAAAFSSALGSYVTVGVVIFALLRGLYRGLYWLPYQVDSLYAPDEMGWARTWREIVVALMPVICGVILMGGVSGLYVVLIGASLIMLASLFLIGSIPDTHEGFSWTYEETFSQLFARRHRDVVTVATLDGISGAALLLFWPIAVFLIVGWSYPVLGFVLSVTYLLVYFIRSYVRNFLRRIRMDRSPFIYALFAASSWILRLVVSSPAGVVLVDSYFYSGTPVRGSGVDQLTFEQSADSGSYIDEYTAIKEIALAFGKIVVCFVGGVLALFLPLAFVFIGVFLIAAIASATSVYISHRAHEV
jgi:hypothetical protein